MKTDARKLSAKEQQEKRLLAVKLYAEGLTQQKVAELLEVNRDTVGKWIRRATREGTEALKAKRKGREQGEGRTLSRDEEKHIQRLICDKRPDQLKMEFALWNRRAVGELIYQELGIEMPVRTVGEYLKRWGMTPQKPLKKAYEQNPKAVQQWLDDTYPEIKARAKAENAEIYWGDETGLRSDTQHGRGYAPKGKTPVIALSAKRSSINMISAITNQGKVRFRLFEGTMNAKKLIDFMRGLIKDAKRKVYLVLDNLRVHHAHVVRDWLAEHKSEIEVFYLPSYSPELNPDEYLNCDLKAAVHSGAPARSKDQLKSKALRHMRKLQKLPARVVSYFEHRCIRYASRCAL